MPAPAWLDAHTEPNIEAMLELLGPEAERLYRRYLAEEVREPRPGAPIPAWRAFDRATCELQRGTRRRSAP
jgi:hypothetical protein